MKRLLSPVTNPAGLTAAGMAVYAAALMIVNVVHKHGVIDVPVIIAAVSAVAALYTRGKVTPVADPRDGNGQPLHAPAPPPAEPSPPHVPGEPLPPPTSGPRI